MTAPNSPNSSQDAEVVTPLVHAKPAPAESMGDEISAPITQSDGDAFAAVKGSARFLANANSVEPSPSDTFTERLA